MNIKKKQEGSTLFVKISGRIDTATSPEVDSYINENLDGVNEVILDFEEVNYWDELCDIFAWARTHVTSTLYICWAAQAGLYYHYGVPT